MNVLKLLTVAVKAVKNESKQAHLERTKKILSASDVNQSMIGELVKSCSSDIEVRLFFVDGSRLVITGRDTQEKDLPRGAEW